MLLAIVAFGMGVIGYLAALGTEQAFTSPFEAIWWAFLRLSDPGYLGDDTGTLLRIVSTIVTVAGYVLFMGVLVAILTQGLNERIRHLEMGLTPISASKHIILLGWCKRTPWIVDKFLLAEGRLLRFLQRVGARRLKLCLLIEEVHPSHSLELRNFAGREWKASRVILRTGSPLRLDHLMRVDYLRAGVIVLPAMDSTGPESIARSDDATIKTILSVAHSLRLSSEETPPPLLVAELYDARKVPTALQSYQGPIEVLASDEIISRMVAQMTRHPHICAVYRELLSMRRGNEIFVREAEDALVGTRFWDFACICLRSIVIGVAKVTPGGIQQILNPDADYRFAKDDRIIFIAENWAHLKVSPVNASSSPEATPTPAPAWPNPVEKLPLLPRPPQKILILGWSRRLPSLLDEYESYENQTFEITLANRTAIEKREDLIEAYGTRIHRSQVKHILTDYTIPDRLAQLQPSNFDIIICLPSEFSETHEEADARSLVALTILRSLLAGQSHKPRILMELLDELNIGLVDAGDCEYLLSPHVVGYMLVEVSLRRELNSVFQELFNSSDTEIIFRDYERYGLSPQSSIGFGQCQAIARQHDEIALGIFKANQAHTPFEGNYLNPVRDTEWLLEAGDKIIVLRR